MSRGRGDHYSHWHVHAAHNVLCYQEKYKVNTYIRVDQPSGVPALTVIWPVKDSFADATDRFNYRLFKNSGWYDDDVPMGVNKMTKETAVCISDQFFSGRDQCNYSPFCRIPSQRVMSAGFMKSRPYGSSKNWYPVPSKHYLRRESHSSQRPPNRMKDA